MMMKTILRTTAFAFALSGAGLLVGCGDADSTTTAETGKTTTTGKTNADATKTPKAPEGTVATPPKSDDSAPATAAIGKPVKVFQVTDTDGIAFDSANVQFTDADVKAAVIALASAEDASLETSLEDATDDVVAFVNRAGRQFGLAASDEAAEEMTTLADVAKWIGKGKTQPLVYMVWSPRCPTSVKLNDRIHEMAQETGARVFAVASNAGDKPAYFEKFRNDMGFSFRVFHDPAQRITDILGGKRTPHFMLVDTDGVLRYRGALDNDVADMKEGADRKDHLRDAIAALQAGKPVPVAETLPVG